MVAQDDPVTLLGDLVGCSSSSHYHQAKQTDDTEIKAAIKAVAGERPTHGYRRIAAQLRRQGWVVNLRRVRCLLHEMDTTTCGCATQVLPPPQGVSRLLDGARVQGLRLPNHPRSGGTSQL